MLNIGSKLLEIFNSNVRPPIKPVISVEGVDNNGNYVYLEWTSNNIVDMSYKRGIDPTGQTLPFIELTWKEFYFGKLNADNYPEKYNNIAKYMVVNLSFVYEQSFYRTWDDISSYTWDEVSIKFETWDKLLKGSSREVIDGFPLMLLVAKPVIEGHTITWTARDILFFLDKDVSKSFATNIPYINPMRWMILNEISRFSKNSDFQWDYLYNTQISLKELETTHRLTPNLIFEGQTKNLLKDFSTPIGWYWDFGTEQLQWKDLSSLLTQKTPVFHFKGKIMRNYPQLIRQPQVSEYQFKRYYAVEDVDSKYTMFYTDIIPVNYENGTVEMYEYLYKGYGKATDIELGDIISKAGYVGYDLPNGLEITPIVYNGYPEKIHINSNGETYVEDNPLNSFGATTNYMKKRAENLTKWYKGYRFVIDSLSNVAIETGDLITVDTNLYSGDNKVEKSAVVTQIEITYNGVLKQKTYANEV
jgi:hypothetical protein